MFDRIMVKSPMVELANANSLTYKIEERHWRVDLQSSTTQEKLNM